MSKAQDASQRREARLASAATIRPPRRVPGGPKSGDHPLKDRRGQILQIAARRFAEFGYESTTIRQIADDAKILSGSIYHHFDTKDEILDDIIRDAVRFMGDNALRIAGAEADAEQKLVALILLALGELTKEQEAHSILYNERKFLRRSPHFEYVAKGKSDMYNAWKTVLDEGVASGLFKPSIDPFLTISTVIRMLNTCADWFRRDGKYELDTNRTRGLDEVIAFNLDFIVRALRHETRITDPIPTEAARSLAVSA